MTKVGWDSVGVVEVCEVKRGRGVQKAAGSERCPSTGVSGARASWVTDRCLERRRH